MRRRSAASVCCTIPRLPSRINWPLTSPPRWSNSTLARGSARREMKKASGLTSPISILLVHAGRRRLDVAARHAWRTARLPIFGHHLATPPGLSGRKCARTSGKEISAGVCWWGLSHRGTDAASAPRHTGARRCSARTMHSTIVVVSRGSLARLVRIKVRIDGNPLALYWPTG